MQTRKLSIWQFILTILICFLIAPPLLCQIDLDKQKDAAEEWIDKHRTQLIEIGDQLWRFSETALLEYRSSALLVQTLKESGFEVEEGVGGLPTAFVASYGMGKPVIGILAEYDALGGLSQKVSSRKEPVEPGAPGHGCGHNLFGIGSVGAAMAVKEVIKSHGLSGTIKLFGCPAEETVVGKTYMARDGIFNDLDAAIAWHPSSETKVNTGSSLALNNFKVSFFGKTAHGAGDPWNGRSALDAVELTNIGVNYLREHIPATARIHYVILNGGKAPNVVPDYAQVWYYVRDIDRKGVEEIYTRVLKIIKGASLMTETTYEIEFITGVHNIIHNIAGTKVLYENLKRVGPPTFSPEEEAFAKAIQAACGKEEKGLFKEIKPFELEPDKRGGSSDVAEVSRITPTVQVRTTCAPIDVPWHSWAVVSCSGHSIGHKGMLVAAKAMALTAIDFMNDGDLLKSMRQEFLEKTEGKPYQAPLPEGLKLVLPKK